MRIITKSNAVVLMLVLLIATPSFIAFAGYNNRNGDNGGQGTNKDSSELPDESNVPPPAGTVEDWFGAPHVVEGCRADGGDEMVYVGGDLGEALGGTCCASNMYVEESIYPLPNQCCNPPDIIYEPDEYTPGNHCLCFVMRMDGPP
jgi:hypothetical protein